MLVERDAELAAIDALVEAACDGRSGVLAFRAEAGIGKTALLDYARAKPYWVRVLRTNGVGAERALPYAGLHLLLHPLLGQLDTLVEPQRTVLGTIWGAGAGGVDHPDNRFLLGLAVLSLLTAAAEHGPLLCAIDDAQWLDDASMQTLQFVARRLDADGVVLLFGLRHDDPRPFPLPIRNLEPLSELGAAAPPKPIGLTINYLRSGRALDSFAKVSIVKQGRRIVAFEAQAWQDDPAKPIASAFGHFMPLRTPGR